MYSCVASSPTRHWFLSNGLIRTPLQDIRYKKIFSPILTHKYTKVSACAGGFSSWASTAYINWCSNFGDYSVQLLKKLSRLPSGLKFKWLALSFIEPDFPFLYVSINFNHFIHYIFFPDSRVFSLFLSRSPSFSL